MSISNPPTPAPGGETMTPELESCPFCGGAAQLAKDYHANRWMVFCPGSLCALDTVEASGIHPSDAVAAWNTRVVPSSTPTRAATDETFGQGDTLNERVHDMLLIAARRLEHHARSVDCDCPDIVPVAKALAKDVKAHALSSSPSSTTATPATPATGCLTPSDCEYASQGWCPRCEKPALPSSRALSEEERKIVRESHIGVMDEYLFHWKDVEQLLAIIDRLTGAPK